MRATLFFLALTSPALAGEVDTTKPRGEGTGAPSGPSVTAPDSLTSLDFVNASDRAEVVLGVSGDASLSAAQSGQVVQILLGLSVPSALRGELDTSFFAAPILKIQAGMVNGQGQVQVELREGATWELKEGEDGFWRFTARFGQHGVLYQGGAPPAESARSLASGSSQMRINLDLVETDIHNVLRLISDTAGVNIVADGSLSGTVTVRLENVAWDEALAAILLSEGLAATSAGGSLVVAPITWAEPVR